MEKRLQTSNPAEQNFESPDLEDVIQHYQRHVGTIGCTASEYISCDNAVLENFRNRIVERSDFAHYCI